MPVFSAELRDQAERVKARYPAGRERSAILPLLYLAQSVEGSVTRSVTMTPTASVPASIPKRLRAGAALTTSARGTLLWEGSTGSRLSHHSLRSGTHVTSLAASASIWGTMIAHRPSIGTISQTGRISE